MSPLDDLRDKISAREEPVTAECVSLPDADAQAADLPTRFLRAACCSTTRLIVWDESGDVGVFAWGDEPDEGSMLGGRDDVEVVADAVIRSFCIT